MRPSPPARILVADDQPDVLEALRLLLKTERYATETAPSPAAVLDAVRRREYDALLMDLNYARDTTSGQEGLDLLSRLREIDDHLPVIVMTAWGSIDLAVEAMRRGARDFIQKPWDNARLLATVRTQVELGAALRRGRRLEAENRVLREIAPSFIADSPAMQPVLQMIARVGPTDANVLVTGESGTGKGLVAQALHAASPRAAGPFVAINMGGLPEGVFESELFGHVRGAFTDAKADRIGRFELAAGGTLFQDEIANLTLAQQARLLRVIETGEFEAVGSSRTRKVDVRIISATNADLRTEVAAGRFRQDLLFRLNTVEIPLPPLRERRDDLPALAEQFLRQHAGKHRKPAVGFGPAALETMRAYAWPGNVRELEHVVERAVLMAEGREIRAADLGLSPASAPATAVEEMSLEEVETLLIRKALARFDGNVSRAAEFLGLSRSALYRRLQRYGL
ncbi:MAG TPA: sigma-54 dependent transcriptional regulator [Thermoanaerobaculia bacterium]|nr:sigma-54 dependent transcriptional regulator [Thermoanaerobaculia bacterium]